MISFNYETEFELLNEGSISAWLSLVIQSENKTEGDINYVFCDDIYLLRLNREYLNHDTLTDIISFDYCIGNELHGDIFISIDRVMENALKYDVVFDLELRRVMVHGILHYCGYQDKTRSQKLLMRSAEDKTINLFHVEQ